MESPFKQLDKVALTALASKMDDKTLLNFCKTDKHFNSKICKDDIFWKGRLVKNYPFLVEFKKGTWKQFYIYNIYWISKLKEEYNFISNDMRDDPQNYYKIFKNYSKELKEESNVSFFGSEGIDSEEFKKRIMEEYLMYIGIELNYFDLVEYSVNNGVDNIQGGLDMSALYGNFETFNYFENLGANDYMEALEWAASSYRRNKKMINLIEKKLH
jgi:hypothetical protein